MLAVEETAAAPAAAAQQAAAVPYISGVLLWCAGGA
jgi:hypothetical protein